MSTVTIHSTDSLTVSFWKGTYNTINNIHLFISDKPCQSCNWMSFVFMLATGLSQTGWYTFYPLIQGQKKCDFFFLITNQTFNSSAKVLLFGCSVLRYILDALLFLQPLPISHRQRIMSPLQSIFLWPRCPPHKDASISQSLTIATRVWRHW